MSGGIQYVDLDGYAYCNGVPIPIPHMRVLSKKDPYACAQSGSSWRYLFYVKRKLESKIEKRLS